MNNAILIKDGVWHYLSKIDFVPHNRYFESFGCLFLSLWLLMQIWLPKKKKKKTGMNNGWIYIDKLTEYIYCSGKNKTVVHKLIGNKIK